MPVILLFLKLVNKLLCFRRNINHVIIVDVVLQGLAIAAVRFRFDGQPINELDTPTTLEMEEGDTIEVYQQQTGGSC